MTEPATRSPVALLVDDDADFLDSLEMLVAREGFETASARTLEEAQVVLAERVPDVVLLDLGLPDGDGWQFLREQEGLEATEIIVITGRGSVDSAVESLQQGALDYLSKPVDRNRLRSCLRHVARTRSLKGEINALRSDLRRLGRFGSLVGGSEPMQHVYDLVARVAPTELCVLIVGESGTGKELVAEAVHRLSARRDGPLVPVNCGAVAPTIIESELFGHERGSFTGADRQHKGYFERCAGGTLFLDEITEMPAELQVKLLRVLESRQVTRVGATQPIPVDVRIVAATNRDPAAAVGEGVLREDLFYRLNVFPIRVPPLRERPGDVRLLAQHFLDRLNAEYGAAKSWSDEALELLERHPFPGNVRELSNLVRRAFVLTDEVIDAASLGRPRPAQPETGDRVSVPIGASLAEVEQRVIEATLERCEGNKPRAAEQLGISLKTLYNRLKIYAARRAARGPSP